MAKTPEAKVKAKVTGILKDQGAYFFYPVTGGFGASGIPDIVGCINGRFFAIECKAGDNKPTALQLHNINAIMTRGGYALVVNEDNINAVEGLITWLKTL
jgi:hypothetical protein